MDPCEGISKIFSPISLSSCERGLVLLLGSDQGVKWSSRHLHTIELTLAIKLFPVQLKLCNFINNKRGCLDVSFLLEREILSNSHFKLISVVFQ